MPIEQTIIGEHAGQPVVSFTIRNRNGLIARIMNFGARLTEMHVPDKAGTIADVVLGFDALSDYIATDTYFGATCGRYCNRIKDGRFTLDGRTVQLTRNEVANHLHGGAFGFDKQVWPARISETENAITLFLVSPRGAEGYPGEVNVAAKYQLTDDNRLLVSMTGTTDEPTILNMVHHSYWNLAGHGSGDVLDQRLTIAADFYTPVDAELMTTGEVLTVDGTPFDFRIEKPIGQDIHRIHNAGHGRLSEDGGGYDHNFVLSGAYTDLRPVATVRDPVSGRGLRLRATEPGVQFYTGGYLNPRVIGKGNQPYRPFAGFTFESQKFPNSPNFAHFPSARLVPGEIYSHRMEFDFFAQ
jgi:aldose 1-epimerase